MNQSFINLLEDLKNYDLSSLNLSDIADAYEQDLHNHYHEMHVEDTPEGLYIDLVNNDTGARLTLHPERQKFLATKIFIKDSLLYRMEQHGYKSTDITKNTKLYLMSDNLPLSFRLSYIDLEYAVEIDPNTQRAYLS